VRNVIVARADELAPGERKIVDVGGRSIGVFNIGGAYFALRNRCPHQGGPLCTGFQLAPLRSARPGEYQRGGEREVIRCPWHGWEFEIKTGRSWFDPQRTRVRSYRAGVHAEPPRDAESYPARSEGGYVVVELDR
jgi:3-phenylpropionate/trans-cinnamate dioxygenase ferredoxin subunit